MNVRRINAYDRIKMIRRIGTIFFILFMVSFLIVKVFLDRSNVKDLSNMTCEEIYDKAIKGDNFKKIPINQIIIITEYKCEVEGGNRHE